METSLDTAEKHPIHCFAYPKKAELDYLRLGYAVPSSAWLDVRVFYLRITGCSFEESPEALSMFLSASNLEVNARRISSADEITLILRRDRVDTDSAEVTYVNIDRLRTTGPLMCKVCDKDCTLICGTLENMDSWKDSEGLNKLGISRMAIKGSIDCKCSISLAGGLFLKKKSENSVSSPSMEVYLAGRCCGAPVILTQVVELLLRKKLISRGILVSIPEADDKPDNNSAMAGLTNAVQESYIYVHVIQDMLQSIMETTQHSQIKKCSLLFILNLFGRVLRLWELHAYELGVWHWISTSLSYLLGGMDLEEDQLVLIDLASSLLRINSEKKLKALPTALMWVFPVMNSMLSSSAHLKKTAGNVLQNLEAVLGKHWSENGLYLQDFDYKMSATLALNGVLASSVISVLLQPLIFQKGNQMLKSFVTRLLYISFEVSGKSLPHLRTVLDECCQRNEVSEPEMNLCRASSLHDICKKDAEHGFKLVLLIQGCLENKMSSVRALGLLSLSFLCEKDLVDVYTTWKVISDLFPGVPFEAVEAESLYQSLENGALDAAAHVEIAHYIIEQLWKAVALSVERKW